MQVSRASAGASWQGRQTSYEQRGEPWTPASFTSLPGSFFLQVNVKKPLKDESHFEVVESGRYIILLLSQGLSVVWDRRLSVSVVLKHTHQVSGPSCSILPVTHVAWHVVTCCPSPLYWKTVFSGLASLLPTQGELSSHRGWLHTGRTEASLTVS